MKSFYIPLLILAILISAALTVGFVTERQTVLWEKAVDQVEYAAEAEDWDRVDEHLTTLSDTWDAWQTFLHVTLPHDHITDTEYAMEECLFHAGQQDADDLMESLMELSGHFHTLSDQGELSLKNLL